MTKHHTEVELVNMKTGEIKKFSGQMLAHKYMLDNKGWIVWSA
jgi:hypothetical protein